MLCMKSLTPEAKCVEDIFLLQLSICTILFKNMSRSGWTWHNLSNLLTINTKYKYFYNSGQGFIIKYISVHD